MTMLKHCLIITLVLATVLLSPNATALSHPEEDQHLIEVRAEHQTTRSLFEFFQSRVHNPTTDPVQIPLLNGRIKLDGELNEAIWQQALVWSLDYEISQAENRPANAPTLFLIALTPHDLIFAFIAVDPNPAAIRYTLTDRDRIGADDRVFLVLDTFGDQRFGFEIFVNPVGVQADALRSESGVGGRRRGPENRQEDFNFDFLWDASTRLLSDGYVVEGRIPLKTLRYQTNHTNTTIWRLAPFREYPRDFTYRLSPVPWDFNNACFLCQLPRVRVKLDKQPGNSLQLIPFVSGNTTARSGEARDNTLNTGLDIKYQPSPRTVIDATIFPDFSQVETDVFQITSNTRFAPFLPEKRPFFLERSDLFATPLQAVYTRTMIDPQFGSRVTGKWGNHTLGFLSVFDDQTQLLFPGVQESSFATIDQSSLNNILRYQYDLGTRSNAGVLLTDKEYTGGYNRVGGADLRLFLNNTTVLTAQGLFTRTKYPASIAADYNQPDKAFNGWAYYLQLNRRGRNWEFRLQWQELDDDFRADLGFIQQAGVRELEALNAFIFWPQGSIIKRWSLFVFGRSRWDRANNPQAQRVTIGSFIRGAGQSTVFLRFSSKRDRVDTTLINSQDVAVDFNIAPLPWFNGGFRLSVGTDPDFKLAIRARRLDMRVNTGFLIARRIQLRTEMRLLSLYDRGLLQDNWTTLVRLEWQFTRRWAIRQIFQYQRVRFLDDRYRALDLPLKDQRWELQSLLRYRVNYATALYIGFYGRWTDKDALTDRSWSIFAKIAYLFNL